MMITTTRREALKRIAWFSAAMSLDFAHGQESANAWIVDKSSNFKAIYGNETLESSFLLFLKDVYGLYPADEFHQLIDRSTDKGETDREIYLLIQSQLSTITPFLSDLRYSRPALKQEKEEMARQTLSTVGKLRTVNGCMEIGTGGRFLDALQPPMNITGDIVLLTSVEPTYSLGDMLERGQITKVGRFVPLKNYQPITPQEVPDTSLDLVINFIGLHHCPPEARDAFVQSVARVLRPGGRMLLREHDVTSPAVNHMVALAHDVANVGSKTPWKVNQQEIRNFTSTIQLVQYLDKLKLKPSLDKGQLLQAGDPTRNALLEFVKV